MSGFKKMMEALDKPVKGIPTVDQVRARFIDYETEMSHCAGWIDGVSDEYGEAFDRWLTTVKAEALREAADKLEARYDPPKTDELFWSAYVGYYGEVDWLRALANEMEQDA